MKFCGIDINCLTFEDLLDKIPKSTIVITVNAEAIVRSQHDGRLRSIMNNNTTTIDGQIPLWLYKIKYKDQRIEKISGSDLIYSLPKYAEKENYRVFLLGGKKDSNKGALLTLKKLYPSLKIEGFSPEYYPYPFPDKINDDIIKRIEKFHPDILFVGFGMGKQEYWEEDYYNELKNIGVKLIIGCGGSFEFASGMIKRAPKSMQRAGLEGIWRLMHEFKWFRIKRLLLSSRIFYYYILDSK